MTQPAVRHRSVPTAGPYVGRPPARPPPPKRNLLPWLIVGGAVLLSGLGILLVRPAPRRRPGRRATAATSTAPRRRRPPRRRERAHAQLPGGAQVADQDTGGGQARFAGFGEVALAWVQAMADGDFQTAYDLSCADVQQSATDAAAE